MPGRVGRKPFLSPNDNILPTWETTNARPAGILPAVRKGRLPLVQGPAEQSSLIRSAPDSAAFIVARGENQFNLARCLQGAGRPAEALPLLEEVCSDLPERIEPVQQLCACYRALGRTEESRRVLEKLARLGESVRRLHSIGFVPQLDLMRGLLDLDDGKRESALRHFAKAQEATPQLPGCTSNSVEFISGCICMTRPRMRFEPRSKSILTHRRPIMACLSRSIGNGVSGGGRTRDAGRGPRPVVRRASSSARALPCQTQRKTEAIVALTHAVQCERRLLLAHRVLARLHAQPPSNGPAVDFHRAAVRHCNASGARRK